MSLLKESARLLAGLTMLGLGACGMTTSDIQNTWLGSTDAELMSAWGVPNRQATAGNGMRILTYKGKDRRGRTVCQKTFTVDTRHRIVAAANDC